MSKPVYKLSIVLQNKTTKAVHLVVTSSTISYKEALQIFLSYFFAIDFFLKTTTSTQLQHIIVQNNFENSEYTLIGMYRSTRILPFGSDYTKTAIINYSTYLFLNKSDVSFTVQ